MTDTSDAKKKAIEKSLFKIRGKLLESKRVGTRTWAFILYKGTGENKRFYALSTSDEQVIYKLGSAVRNQRFKAKFHIKSSLHKERWYTNLLCVSLEDWIINEDKISHENRMKSAQTEMFENSQYSKSILPNNQNSDF